MSGLAAPRLEKKHPLAIRWLHWVNFPALLIMLWSGLLIYWGRFGEKENIGINRTFGERMPARQFQIARLAFQVGSGSTRRLRRSKPALPYP